MAGAVRGLDLVMGIMGSAVAVYAVPSIGFLRAAGLGLMTFGGMRVVQHTVRRYFIPERIPNQVVHVGEKIAEIINRHKWILMIGAGSIGIAYDSHDKFFAEARDCNGYIECSVRLSCAALLNITVSTTLSTTLVTMCYLAFKHFHAGGNE